MTRRYTKSKHQSRRNPRKYSKSKTYHKHKSKGKYCHFCGKKLDDLLPFECNHCGELFCKDHYLPENHECPDFKPRSWIKPVEEPSKKERPYKRKKLERRRERPRARRQYSIWQTIRYKSRKTGIPIWFLTLFSIMILVAVIHQFYIITLFFIELPTIFYLLEIIVISYFMFRLVKKLDKIYVGSNLRLFGLRILSLIFGFTGLILFYFAYIGPFFALFDENIASVLNFGADFGLSLTGKIFFVIFGLGLSIIGCYLFFKFKRKTGQFVWFGRA